ncbi:hypothetical protein psal_cds_1254 [Pandoravirus salinus]|uniref:DUF5860 domain-containing protein n=1 Tax=Pandoravirus salinus TaxID=1349410 RepID=S4VY38_9VIRU|nr:hypothetical protein psal_cds_1254 [Pandoravirus salinus]AGO85589.1 hypothetical protein psal_cds_1254 [Pandoravirus salinus]
MNMTTATAAADGKDLARLYPCLDVDSIGRLTAIATALDGRVPYKWAPTGTGLERSVLLSDGVCKCATFIAWVYSVVVVGDRPWCVRMGVDAHDPHTLRFGVFVEHDDAAMVTPPHVALARTGASSPSPAGPAAGTPVIAAQSVDDIGRLYPWLSAADLIKASALHDALADVPHAWAIHAPDGPLVDDGRFCDSGIDAIAAAVRQRHCGWPDPCRSGPVILALTASVDRTSGRTRTGLLFGPADGASGDRRVPGRIAKVDRERTYRFFSAGDIEEPETPIVLGAPRRRIATPQPGPLPDSVDVEATATGAVVLGAGSAAGRATQGANKAADDKDKAADADCVGSRSSVTAASQSSGDVAVPAGFEALARSPARGGTVAWVCALAHGLGDVPIEWTETRLATDIVLHMSTPAEAASMVVDATYRRGCSANTKLARAVLGIDDDALGGPLLFYRINIEA